MMEQHEVMEMRDVEIALVTERAACAAEMLGKIVEFYLKAAQAQDAALGNNRNHSDRVADIIDMLVASTDAECLCPTCAPRH